ncbi:MAG: hypothetical protein R3264_22585, partial [Anaerolineae bacterium]|nr:hypothetical protein [Anaerolineae bacterium]
LPNLNAVHVGLLTNAVVTAVTASILFVWLTDLGFARLSAALTTLAYGLCTIAWVYARMFWESSLLALSFLVAVWAIYRSTRLAYARQRLVWIAVSGIAIAIGLTLRFETAPAIIFIGLFILWESVGWRFSQLSEVGWSLPEAEQAQVFNLTPTAKLGAFLGAIPWGRLLIYILPTLLIGLGLLYFNLVRYGSLSETGYSQELLFRAPWVGGYGLLLSPGRGLFLYAPLTILLFFGIRPARRRLSFAYFWMIAALCLFYWLFYGSWFAWGGTWGWGPRFLLPILPLLMLFVAEPIEWLYRQTVKQHLAEKPLAILTRLPRANVQIALAWAGLGVIIGLSLIVNLLGIVVDFNEHFLRLNRNDNFVFNWATFPPLAHWQIMQEGRLDLIWLRTTASGPVIEWSILTPALLLVSLATVGLGLMIRLEVLGLGKVRLPQQEVTHYRQHLLAEAHTMPRTTLAVLLFVLLPLMLTYQMMTNTALAALENGQLQADNPLLTTLARDSQPGDALLVPSPPYGDVQEISTALMAYFDQPLPTSI